MATIRKRGDKYQAQVRRRGYTPVSKTFHRLSDAREWARLIETQADRKELAPDTKVLETTRLSDLVKRYRDEVSIHKRSAETEIITLSAFLRHPINRKTLAELTPSDFAKYRDERLAKVQPATLKRQFNTLRHMFHYAHDEWDYPLHDHPLRKVKIKSVDNKRQRRLKAGELEQIEAACALARNPYGVLIIRFALETGMRRGEILSLTLNDVDLPRAQLTVRESKNGHSRVIPLTSAAVRSINSALALSHQNRKIDQELVFPVTANAFKLLWRRVVKRAVVDDLRFHDLRHEAISRLFELGLTVPEVASISGHRDPRMLFRYAHANHDRIREKLDASGSAECVK